MIYTDTELLLNIFKEIFWIVSKVLENSARKISNFVENWSSTGKWKIVEPVEDNP